MGSIRLGEGDRGQPILMDQETREMHMHVMGQSRMGKSYFLESMIRQDIEAGNGVCVIDPHGEMYENLVSWLASTKVAHRRNVHLINPAEDEWSVGFNPFGIESADPNVRVDFMVDACMKVWGGRSVEERPRLAKCLSLIFSGLVEKNLTIAEARYFYATDNPELRHRITSGFKHQGWQADWDNFNSYRPQDFRLFMESAESCLRPFINNAHVERLMGQTQNLINFRTCMDRQDIVLVNLSGKGKLSDRDAQVIGALMFSDLFLSAKGREIRTAKYKPFYCYVDECADYITEDVARSLDQTAKFGLHYVLSHQRIQQIAQYGENFFEAIMSGAQSKVIFRVDHDESAEKLSRHLFRKEFDIESRKQHLTQPVAVGQEMVTLRGGASTRGGAHSATATRGGASSSGGTTSSSTSDVQPDGRGGFFDPPPPGSTISTDGDGSSWMESTNWSDSEMDQENWSEQDSWSQTFRTIFEERGIPYTLDELIHEGIQQIRSLPKRTALVYLSGAPRVRRMHTDDMETYATMRSVKRRAVAHFVTRSAFTSTTAHIKNEIHARHLAHGFMDPIALNEGDPVDLDEDDEGIFRQKTGL